MMPLWALPLWSGLVLIVAGCEPYRRHAEYGMGESECPPGAQWDGLRCVRPVECPAGSRLEDDRCVALAPAPSASSPDPIVGAFTVAGARPDGATYTGDAAVTALAQGGPYKVVWTVAGSSYGGIATKRGDILSVGWGDDGHGVVDFVAKGDGTLDGVWYDGKSLAPGRETLVGGLPNLAGVYTIEKGIGPSGDAYSGSCDLAVTGELHVLMWHVGKDTFRGLGIRSGDVLSVGFSTAASGAFGVVQYRIQGNKLVGRWGEWSQKVPTLGSETLTHK